MITLATVLAATDADQDGASYFEVLAASQPDQVLPLTLAGYFQVRSGKDIPGGLARLDNAATKGLGPAPQALYRLMERHQLLDPFRFLIYAELAGVELPPAL